MAKKKAKGKKRGKKKVAAKRVRRRGPRDVAMVKTGVVGVGAPPLSAVPGAGPIAGGPLPTPVPGRRRLAAPRRAASPTKGPKCASPM